MLRIVQISHRSFIDYIVIELRAAGEGDLRLDVWKRLLFAHPDNPDIRSQLRDVIDADPKLFNRVIARYLDHYVESVGPLNKERWLALQKASNQQEAPWWAWKVAWSERYGRWMRYGRWGRNWARAYYDVIIVFGVGAFVLCFDWDTIMTSIFILYIVLGPIIAFCGVYVLSNLLAEYYHRN